MKNKKTIPAKKNSSKNSHTIDGLSHLLADTYILYVKTQNCHWNVISPDFYALHKMFEEQYGQLAGAVDVIAERIRALDAHTPASMGLFLKMTSLEEIDNSMSARDMVKELMRDHETMGKNLMVLFSVAEDAQDEVTLDMLIQRKTEHDKTAWMLRSTLGS